MATVLLVIHLMIAVGMIAVVLLQRSEGGGLGIGGGGGGFMTGRGTANFLTRATAVLAGCFFLTSLGLTLLVQRPSDAGSVLDRPASTGPATPGTPVAPTEGTQPPAAGRGGVLDKLQQGQAREQLPSVPANR